MSSVQKKKDESYMICPTCPIVLLQSPTQKIYLLRKAQVLPTLIVYPIKSKMSRGNKKPRGLTGVFAFIKQTAKPKFLTYHPIHLTLHKC